MLYVVTKRTHRVPLSIYTPSPATLRLLLMYDSDRPCVHARARGRLIAACALRLHAPYLPIMLKALRPFATNRRQSRSNSQILITRATSESHTNEEAASVTFCLHNIPWASRRLVARLSFTPVVWRQSFGFHRQAFGTKFPVLWYQGVA